MNSAKIKRILKKKNKTPLTCLTAYSKTTAQVADKYCDIILVGDSLGMVLYGLKSTKKVKMKTMIEHCKVVKNYAKKSLVVFDMPYKTYKNESIAYKNAKYVMQATKCDAVKLEGGKKIIKIINYLVKKGIPVMGHIGVLPQTAKIFRAKGKNNIQSKNIFKDAIAVSKSGAFSIVLECIVENLAKKITKGIKIPTIGIGASKYCDGQILVIDDMLGLSDFHPKFVKKYSNLKNIMDNAIKNYSKDVKLRKFPTNKNVYN